MRLLSISLENFRNIGLAHLKLDSSKHSFFIGPNGQGKTNLLESIYFLSALRSFRTQQTRSLIQHEKKQAQLLFNLEHELHGNATVKIQLSAHSKTVFINESKVEKLADFIGQFPVVILSADDMQMLRGAPALRRRFIDLTLSSVSPAYFTALRSYHKALAQRNALLRQTRPDLSLITSYESIMAEHGTVIVDIRKHQVGALAQYLVQSYCDIACSSEVPEFSYSPDLEGGFIEKWQTGRERDLILKTTSRGPHRDEYLFKLQSREAKTYASEGQQRALVIALKLAQMNYYRDNLNIAPLVLADDVLGQLDPDRSARFWAALEKDVHVLATGTESFASVNTLFEFSVMSGCFYEVD